MINTLSRPQLIHRWFSLNKKKPWIEFLFVFFVFLFLFFGTGIHGDDFDHLFEAKKLGVQDFIKLSFLNDPISQTIAPAYFIHRLSFWIIDEWMFGYALLKSLYCLFFYFCLQLFFSNFTNLKTAKILALFIVWYPTHDATSYWVVGQYLNLNMALSFLAAHFMWRGRLFIGTFVAFISAFYSYGSIPFFSGLSWLFIYHRRWKQFFLWSACIVSYTVWYFLKMRSGELLTYRTEKLFNLSMLPREFFLQWLTYLDSNWGVAFALKSYYSFANVGWVLASLFLLVVFITKRKIDFSVFNGPPPKILFISSLFIAISGALIFSLTGGYPVINLSLGNRVNIFYTPLSVMLVWYLMSKISAWLQRIVLTFFVVMCLGISLDWKSWTSEQQRVLKNIIENSELTTKLFSGGPVFFIKSQYSHFGPFAHISFFADSPITPTQLAFHTNQMLYIYQLNPLVEINDNIAYVRKYNRTFPIPSSLTIYDSVENTLFTLPSEKLSAFISNLPPEPRHWLNLSQFVKIKNLFIIYFPRYQGRG